jgi:hypothetical protein
MSTTTAIINRVFAAEGAAAAAARAELIGAPRLAAKIRAGEWNRQPAKPVEVPLGSKGDVSLHAVKFHGKVVRIVKSVRGESGEIVSAEPLDTVSIVEAMKIIL